MHDKVGIPSDWRREMHVTLERQTKVPFVAWFVHSLFQAPQHQLSVQAFIDVIRQGVQRLFQRFRVEHATSEPHADVG